MRRAQILLLAVVVFLLAACNLTTHVDPPPGAVAPTFAPMPPPGPARPQLTVQFCNDDTGSYPRAYFSEANALMASALAQSVIANQDGVTLFATAITHNTFDPHNTLFPAFNVPKIEAYPTPPTPLPTAVPQGPVTDPPTETAIAKQDTRNITDFNQAVAQLNQQIQTDKTTVSTDAKRLLTWNPAVDDSATSILGCFELASENFQGQPGLKMVYIASDLVNNTNLDYTSSLVTSHKLKGVVVHVIFLYSKTAPEDQQKRSQWCSYLKSAGATTVLFNNEVTSKALSGTDMFTHDSGLSQTEC